MKFGKRYREQIPETFARESVEYKPLKALIKACSVVIPPAFRQQQQPARALVRRNASSRAQDEFLSKLRSEFAKVCACYPSWEKFCSDTQVTIQGELFRLCQSPFEEDSGDGNGAAVQHVALQTSLAVLYQQQVALCTYLELNWRALRKITKKFDKWVGSSEGARLLATLRASSPLLDSSRMRSQLLATEAMQECAAGLRCPITASHVRARYADRAVYAVGAFDVAPEDAEAVLRMEYAMRALRCFGTVVIIGVLDGRGGASRFSGGDGGNPFSRTLQQRMDVVGRYADVVLPVSAGHSPAAALTEALSPDVLAAGKVCYVNLPCCSPRGGGGGSSVCWSEGSSCRDAGVVDAIYTDTGSGISGGGGGGGGGDLASSTCIPSGSSGSTAFPGAVYTVPAPLLARWQRAGAKQCCGADEPRTAECFPHAPVF